MSYKSRSIIRLLVATFVILACSLLFSCTQECNCDKTTTTTERSPHINIFYTYEYHPEFYIGVWSKSLVSENTFENGMLDLIYYSNSPYVYDDTVVHNSMRTAVYTPAEFSADFCEIAVIKFVRNSEDRESYKITYAYDYADKVLYCNYEDLWYTVSEYDALVRDIIFLSGSISYNKMCSYTAGPDESCYELNKDYFKAFSYERFFAYDGALDPSIYSGFVNTEPHDTMTKELAVELAKKEALSLDANIEYWDCFYDPYTSYWYVILSGDSLFIDVYLNEYGQTVQISTRIVNRME